MRDGASLPRRRFLGLAAAGAVFPLAAPRAEMDAFPSRSLHLIVGFGPGGSPDIIARLIGQVLSERLGQQIVVENRPGAGTTLATETVARANPDGYTLLVVTTPNVTSALLYRHLSFDFASDIAPIALVGLSPQVMVVNPAFAARSVPDLIAYAKANPGKVNFASTGSGNLSHLSLALFKMMADVDIVHVPYRGAGPAQTDILGGRIDGMIDTVPTLIDPVRSGRLRGLAVTATKRLAALPDLPTMGDFVPGFEVDGVIGIGAPRGTPPQVVGRLNREINAALTDPRLQAHFADLATLVRAGSPDDFAALLAAETDKWRRVIRTAKIEAD